MSAPLSLPSLPSPPPRLQRKLPHSQSCAHIYVSSHRFPNSVPSYLPSAPFPTLIFCITLAPTPQPPSPFLSLRHRKFTTRFFLSFFHSSLIDRAAPHLIQRCLSSDHLNFLTSSHHPPSFYSYFSQSFFFLFLFLFFFIVSCCTRLEKRHCAFFWHF